ncbi:MAG: hypothetical protein BRC24_00930 [Parcubacteria group bacterium SW_4_46_8]|nr:MAG: hypothetical protein BRC24_00930 [Parcubacteria group bacterium SW_4_46_8]
MKRKLVQFFFPLVQLYWKIFGKPDEGVRAVITHQNKVLLVRQSYLGDRWHLPGGFKHAHESPKAAIRRELDEELHLEIPELQFAQTNDIGSGDNPTHVHIFTVSIEKTDIEHTSIELTDAKWFDLNNLPDESPAATELLNDFFQSEENVST